MLSNKLYDRYKEIIKKVPSKPVFCLSYKIFVSRQRCVFGNLAYFVADLPSVFVPQPAVHGVDGRLLLW